MSSIHPLIMALVERHDFGLVDEHTIETVAQPLETAMLLVAGDAVRLPEVPDVAVVAPELVKAFRGRITGLLATTASEPHMQMRFGFDAFPALVFLRRGAYLGALTRIRDWSEYMAEIPAILERTPSAPPQFTLGRAGCASLSAEHIH
jgi:hydrogenase-1 operon protein HyaE